MYTYSDSQNYLSRPLLQWRKRGEKLKKFIRVEQASEHKKINFAQCKIKNFTAKFTKIQMSNISQNYLYTFKNQREVREIHRKENWK